MRWLIVLVFLLGMFCEEENFFTRSMASPLLGGSPLSGQTHENFVFNQQSLAYSELIQAKFIHAHFNLSSWFGNRIALSTFEETEMKGLIAKNCILEKVTFRKVNLSGAKFTNCHFKNVTFKDCRLDATQFVAGKFESVQFINSDLSRLRVLSGQFKDVHLDSESKKSLPSSLQNIFKGLTP